GVLQYQRSLPSAPREDQATRQRSPAEGDEQVYRAGEADRAAAADVERRQANESEKGAGGPQRRRRLLPRRAARLPSHGNQEGEYGRPGQQVEQQTPGRCQNRVHG